MSPFHTSDIKHEDAGGRELSPLVDAALLACLNPTAVVITESLRVVETRGDLSKAGLAATAGRLKGAAIELIRPLLADGVRSVDTPELRITATPIPGEWDGRIYCVVFESRELERELALARESLATLLDESETTTEELRSAVEELRAANGELDGLNRELSSANQDTARVNARLETRTKEAERSIGELSSLLASLKLAIVVVGPDLRVRRIAGPAARVLGLLGSETGMHIGRLEGLRSLETDCVAVMESQLPVAREFGQRAGRVLHLVIRPYTTDDNQAKGVAIAVIPGAAAQD